MSEKRRKIILPIVILLAGVMLTVVMIKSRAPVPTRPPAEFAPLVRVVDATPQPHQFMVTAHGTVTPRTETSLVAEVSGRVVGIAPAFASGGFFKKGDVLLTIDPVDYELAVVSSQSQVAQAKVRAELEAARAEVAREEWKALGDGETSPLATRELQLEEARSALAAAEASLKQAKRNLARTQIRAPFACRVRQKFADLGQFVAPGVKVASIYAIDVAEIRLPIPDAELAYVDLSIGYRTERDVNDGPSVRLHGEFAGKAQVWSGKIVRLEGEIDPTSRMVHVVAQVDDPYGQQGSAEQPPLSFGLFVRAEIAGRKIDQAFVLPRSALRADNIIHVVDENDRLRFQPVEVLRVHGEEVVIAGGVSSGDRVSVSSLEAVTDGMKVRTLLAETSNTRSSEAAEGEKQ